MFQSHIPRWVFLLLVTLLGWAGLALQFYLILQAPGGHSLHEAAVLSLTSFAVLPNLVAVLALTLTLLFGPQFPSPSFMTGLAVGFLLVWLTDTMVLTTAPLNAQWLADMILHFTMPILFALFWTLFVPKGQLHWSAPFFWLLWPVFYLNFALGAGMLTGHYPHPLTDIVRLGRAEVYFSFGIAAMAFLLLGLIVAMLDKLMAPLKPRI